MSTTPTPAPQPPAGTPPKKSNALLWILGIFGGLVLFGILAVVGIGFFVMHKVKQTGMDSALMQKNPGLAAAKMAVSFNPELEIVSSNDSAGTIVVRNKKDGKIISMKFDPEKKSMVITDEKGNEAKISTDGNSANVEVKGDNGNAKFGAGATAEKAPSWVPIYPGSNPQNTMSVNENGKQSGAFVFTTTDSADKVLSFYGQALKSAGLTVTTTTSTTDSKVSGVVNGEDKDTGHTVGVIVGNDSNGVTATVTYSEKKVNN
jgi:hypothetical protein